MTRKRKKRASIVVEKVTPYLAVGGDHGVSLWDVKRNEELYATVSAGRGRTSVLCRMAGSYLTNSSAQNYVTLTSLGHIN